MLRILSRRPSLRHLALWVIALSWSAGGVLSSRAEVSLPKILGDGMVLQRDIPAPVWGRAAAGEAITVRFAGQEKATVAGADGHWEVALDPLDASRTPREMTVAGSNVIHLGNILVGEVWLCSGQSNMEYAVGVSTAGAPAATQSDPALAEEIKTADFPALRLFRVEKKLQPPEVVSGGWSEARGEAIARFSAAGYFFARRLQGELNVPVGLIQAAWGGSRIEPWTPAEAYPRLPAFAREAAVQPLQIDGMAPGKYYDGMVRPLAPFGVRGVLWYQGESNIIATNDGLRYADKMQALVEGWRTAWRRPDLPFYCVQIAPFHYTGRKADPVPHSDEELPKLWEAQARALQLPHTGIVPITDLVDDLDNIHPGHKREVGGRLAALALAETYGRHDLVHSGPVFSGLTIDGPHAVVRFDGADALVTRDGKPPTGFEVAGKDGAFVPAEAAIHGTRVDVFSPAVTSPVAVRFGWHETGQFNLMNTAGWPAYPFRSNGPVWPNP